MKEITCPLEGLFLYEAKKFGDQRGYFFESFRHDFFRNHIDEKVHFVQDNVSRSTKGILRGLHFQAPPYAQAKLVHVVQGEVFDVAVDIRKDSPTYGQWHAIELTLERGNALLVPEGCAHGFQVLEPASELLYLHSGAWVKEAETGLRWDDPSVAITWPLPVTDLSDRDCSLPFLSDSLPTNQHCP